MEATGRDDGGRGPASWSYRRHDEIGSTTSYTISSSSRSGTIVSTTYTSGGSRLSSGISMEEAALLQLDLELGVDTSSIESDKKDAEADNLLLQQLDLEWQLGVGAPCIETDKKDVMLVQPSKKPCKDNLLLQQLDLEWQLGVGAPCIETDKKDVMLVQPRKKPCKETEEKWKKKKMKYVKSMVQEFFRAPSANRSILGRSGRGGMNAVERWFSELGVRWVLHLNVAEYASAWVHGHPTIDDIWRWTQALTQIMETIRLTASFFPDHGHGFVGMPGISEQEVDSGKQAATSLDPVQFALFFQKTVSKMLVFVDVMFSKSICLRGPQDTSTLSLVSCLDVHSALSEVLLGFRLQFHSPPPEEVEKIEMEMVSLLSAKQGKAFEAIWNAMEEIRTRVHKSMEDSSGTQSPQQSSDIHNATYLVMDHINFLLNNHSTVTPLVSQAANVGKYVPQTGLREAPPFISLIMEMVSRLQEQLFTKLQLFLDKGLGLVFLLNNSNFIRENLKYTLSYTKVDVEIVTCKDELGHYIESYIQVSWAPMLSCLSNHAPLCLGRNYSPLSKFEFEFQKIYTTQKLWKVPDPGLRKRLRKAVIEKVIPCYTKYIEDNKITNPKFTPQELEEMLQELFEG